MSRQATLEQFHFEIAQATARAAARREAGNDEED
jgi:hypothetical protein